MVVPGVGAVVVSVVTLPIEIVGGVIEAVRTRAEPKYPSEPQFPPFLPEIGILPPLDITEEIPTNTTPGKRIANKVLIIPEELFSYIPNPYQLVNHIRTIDSPAETLRDIEGPLEILMAIPGPIRELPNPVADIYYLRQSFLWMAWDGRTLVGSGFDNFLRTDLPEIRASIVQAMHESRDTASSIRDTNVQMRRKIMPSIQKTVNHRLPRTEHNVDIVLDKLAQFLDGGLFGFLF